MRQGILFVGHGTRVTAGVQEFGTFVAEAETEIKGLAGEKMGACWFGSCFLELKRPTITEAIRNAVEVGCQGLIVAPIFLFSARHIKSDIPLILSAARNQYPDLSICCLDPLGNHNAVVVTCVDRIFESGFCPDVKRTCFVFVSRGGKDKSAREEFRCVVQNVIDNIQHFVLFQSGCKEAYLAGEGPRLQEALVAAMNEGYKSVYVVPILLFQGQLTLELKYETEQWNVQKADYGMEVILTSHLGTHRSLIESVANCILYRMT